MVRRILSILFLSGLAAFVAAQEMKVVVNNDSAFNIADAEAQTYKGFDVDVTKTNQVDLGIQIAQDVMYGVANNSEITDNLTASQYHRQRVDLMLSSALPEKTNVYVILSFLNINPANSSSAYQFLVSNLEIEHYFRKSMKIRVGRLINSVSESQFYGRIAIEESSAHYYGRKIYINDALEFDMSPQRKGGMVCFFGLKPDFKPLAFKAFYAGFHLPWQNGMQMNLIGSVNRQTESTVQSYVSDYQGSNVYGSYEAEVAYKKPTVTAFMNVGGNFGYVGLLPHVSGNMDFFNQFDPIIESEGDALKETFMGSVGLHLHPSKMSKSWSFLPMIGVETELQGALTDRFTAINVCALAKFSLTKRMMLTYYCTPQFIWQKFNTSKPEYTGGVVNFLRLTVMVGKSGRTNL